MLAPVFKKDGNLDFNISKTKVLAKGPSADHMFERAKHFLDTDPDLADIAHHSSHEGHVQESRQRVLKYLELRWAMTVSFRPLSFECPKTV